MGSAELPELMTKVDRHAPAVMRLYIILQSPPERGLQSRCSARSSGGPRCLTGLVEVVVPAAPARSRQKSFARTLRDEFSSLATPNESSLVRKTGAGPRGAAIR